MKATEQCFPVVLFIILYKVVLTCAKIAPVMQVIIQVVKTWMITLRLFSYHSTYSHCVVLFHHFFWKHGGQSNDRRFFRMISLKTKTMSMRKFSLLIPNCYQRASWEKWVVNNLLWGFLALLWSLTGIFIKHCTSINSKNCYSDGQYIRDL